MKSPLAQLCVPWTLLLLGCAQPSPSTAETPALDAPPTTKAAPPAAHQGRADRPKDKEPAMPDPESAERSRGPAVRAAVLRGQLLDLIGGLRSFRDLERSRIESILQVKLVEERESREGFRYDGRTTEGWTYGLSVSRLYGLSEPPVILIGLDNGVEPWTDQKPTYCTLDFESLAQDIVALGYERDSKPWTRGAAPSWGFGKNVADGKAGFAISVYVYSFGADYPDGQACVGGFRISGGRLE